MASWAEIYEKHVVQAAHPLQQPTSGTQTQASIADKQIFYLINTRAPCCACVISVCFTWAYINHCCSYILQCEFAPVLKNSDTCDIGLAAT